jgi:hypothetical protein
MFKLITFYPKVGDLTPKLAIVAQYPSIEPIFLP